MFRMPNGQYCHWQLRVVPPSYLRWYLSHRDPPPSLRRAIFQELERLKVDKSRPGYPTRCMSTACVCWPAGRG
jgi:hypothetical protein